MANHKLHGEWISTRISSDGTAIVPDGNIFLRMTNAATGEIQAGSNHDGVPVTGDPTPTGASVELAETMGNFTRRYRGFLITEVDILGQKFRVLAGRWRNTPNGRDLAAQEEGTWVATKTG